MPACLSTQNKNDISLKSQDLSCEVLIQILLSAAVLEYPVPSEFIGTASNVAACKITGQASSKQGSNLDETRGDRIPVLYEERNKDNNKKVGTDQVENSI
ncbi:hypothetical protein QYF36_014802 [Acer negundo]|nr:hypothetical protein QYF36_014802 [Acer negundo]